MTRDDPQERWRSYLGIRVSNLRNVKFMKNLSFLVSLLKLLFFLFGCIFLVIGIIFFRANPEFGIILGMTGILFIALATGRIE